MKYFIQSIVASCIVASSFVAPIYAEEAHKEGDHENMAMELPKHAIVVMLPTAGNMVMGTLMLDVSEKGIHIAGSIKGLTPGEHGFHIHEFGDVSSPDGKSAGGHYSTKGHEHGSPNEMMSHEGDLGNITADANGVAKVDVMATHAKLHFILGRSFVIHAGKDDLKSQPSGDSGARVAVGVIGMAADK